VSLFVSIENSTSDIPIWLNRSQTNLKIITHNQLFSPESIRKGALPTKNSNAIESQLYRLNTTRFFFYLNDDVIIGKPLKIKDILNPKTKSIVFQFSFK